MASVVVRVHDGTSWNMLSDVDRLTIRRRVASGEAEFRLPNASVANRALLLRGRETEVKLTVGGTDYYFGGFMGKPRLKAVAPGKFNMYCRVEDLTHGAKWHIIVQFKESAGQKYTDTLRSLWFAGWTEVDGTGVVGDAATSGHV